jgi:hypothetical protein
MPLINVERFNHTIKKLEPALINSDAIVWVREFHIPGVPAHKKPWACNVWLTSGDCLSIHSTIEELQEAIYFASLDAKPAHLEGNPWSQTRKLLT